MSFGLPDLSAAVRQFIADNLPGRTPLRVLIFTLEDQKPLSLPVCIAPTRPADSGPVFVPDAFQTAILSALEGKAMRTDALGTAVGDRSRLFKKPKGGLQELRDEGLVEHHPRLGYYRPDAPPPELSG